LEDHCDNRVALWPIDS